MSDFPSDLVPLPTSPWDIRPTELPLDVEECRTAIWRCRGNITKAAELLKVDSKRLRKFVAASRYLTEELEEAGEQLVDLAEDVAYDALTDAQDPGRRDSMARFVMAGRGRNRGHGTGGGKVSIGLPGPKGTVVIKWEDGSTISGNDNEEVPGDNAKVINP